MTRIPRNQATALEITATFIGLMVYIGFVILELPILIRIPDGGDFRGQVLMCAAAAIGFCATYLLMVSLMPTWGVVALETFRQPGPAERFARWAAARHPLVEQRLECAVRAAYLAWNRGDTAQADQDAEKGLAITEKALDRPAISFYYALCLQIRAWNLQNEGRYQEALEQYGRAVRLNLRPPSLTAQNYGYAAGLLYVLGRFEEALLFSEQAIAGSISNPDSTTAAAHRWAALSLAELSRYDEAVEHCAAGMVIEPTTAVSILLLADHAWLQAMAGKTTEAEDSFAKLHAAATEGVLVKLLHQEYHEVLGRVRLSQGRLEEAEAALRASLKAADGQHLSALYHLAIICEKKGDVLQAQQWRERLLREAPESFYAQRLRDQASGVIR